MKILTIGFLSALVLIGIGVGVFLGTKTSEEIAPTIEPTQEPTQNPTIEPTNSNPTTKTQTFINKLDEYVHTDDGYYHWTASAWTPDDGDSQTGDINYAKLSQQLGVETINLMRLQSQKWLNESVTSKPIWEHNVWICTANATEESKDSGLLWIEAGSNPELQPKFDDFAALICQISAATNSVVVYLKQIPNQPIVYADDPEQKPRTEDGFIAYGWRKFLDNWDNGNPEILARFPMTKAAVKAMDMTSEFVLERKIRDNEITRWCVGGGSKRAWTSWIAAAVDDRINCAFPVVDSLLNVSEALHNHYKSLGGWSSALYEYYDQGIFADIDSPKFAEMMDFVDPYSYKDRLQQIPIQEVSGTGDQLFLIDDHKAWHSEDWQNSSWLHILPNLDHGLVGDTLLQVQAVRSMTALHDSMIRHEDLPRVHWKAANNLLTVCYPDETPDSVALWRGVSKSLIGRDFRLKSGEGSQNDKIFGKILECEKDRSGGFLDCEIELVDDCFLVEGDLVEGSYVATYLEMNFITSKKRENHHNFVATSGVLMTPDVYKFEDCENEECAGVLV